MMAHVTLYDFRKNIGKYMKKAKTAPVFIMKSKTGDTQFVLLDYAEFQRLRGFR